MPKNNNPRFLKKNRESILDFQRRVRSLSGGRSFLPLGACRCRKRNQLNEAAPFGILVPPVSR